MRLPETQAVIAALSAQGGEMRFVGGCVRDAMLHRAIKDVDIATHLPPDEVMVRLEEAGIRAIPTGIAHGTVTAVLGKAHYEITTLRRDVETFGRHARIAFTNDWTADAARRDFTINAMFADAQGRVYDPFGGLADLAAGRVCFVGRAQTRIEEDVLRLLRFFRFHAHYGRPPMDAAALAACRHMAPRLVDLSGERVAGELLRLLDAPDPASVLIVMKAEQVLDYVLREATAFGRLRMLTWLETRAMVRATIRPDAMRRLAAVLETDRPDEVAERLKLSAAQSRRLEAMAKPVVAVTMDMDQRAARRALRRVGQDIFRDLVLVGWADHRSHTPRPAAAESAQWLALLDQADSWEPVSLPVRGQDCLDLGVPHGPAIGAAMAALEHWWEDHDYRPGRDECLGKLRELVGR